MRDQNGSPSGSWHLHRWECIPTLLRLTRGHRGTAQLTAPTTCTYTPKCHRRRSGTQPGTAMPAIRNVMMSTSALIARVRKQMLHKWGTRTDHPVAAGTSTGGNASQPHCLGSHEVTGEQPSQRPLPRAPGSKGNPGTQPSTAEPAFRNANQVPSQARRQRRRSSTQPSKAGPALQQATAHRQHLHHRPDPG